MPTLAMVELFVQSSYFIFQVVQVFLVTTLTSAVSGAIGEIINDPMSAQVLLSENLPTSSNFYVSYLILQGLAMSATRVVHLPTLQMVLSSPLKSPRRISIRWHRLRRVYWGSVFPLFTNMGVIGTLLVYPATPRSNLLNSLSNQLFMYRAYNPRVCRYVLLHCLPGLSLQPTLCLLVRNRYPRTSLPSRLKANPHRRVPRRSLSHRALRSPRRLWTLHHDDYACHLYVLGKLVSQ